MGDTTKSSSSSSYTSSSNKSSVKRSRRTTETEGGSTAAVAGEEEEVDANPSAAVWMNREELETFVNAALMEAMDKNSKAYNLLDRDRRGIIAELIATKKEKLLQLFENHEETVITAPAMQSMLQEMVQDDEK